MWENVRDRVKAQSGGPLLERITEKLNRGVPDVTYQFGGGEAGWVELKWLAKPGKAWPLVAIPWKSTDQPLWLWRWARAGGRAGVLLKIADVGWFYWRPDREVGWMTRIQGQVDVGTATWAGGPVLDLEGLLGALRK